MLSNVSTMLPVLSASDSCETCYTTSPPLAIDPLRGAESCPVLLSNVHHGIVLQAQQRAKASSLSSNISFEQGTVTFLLMGMLPLAV